MRLLRQLIETDEQLKKHLLNKLYQDLTIEIHTFDDDEESGVGYGWAIVDGYKLSFPWSEDYGIYDDQVEIEKA